jgi:predicted ATP-dependent endonuclease of OLD family
MKLIGVRINNYRSCRAVDLKLNGMHALVGANNAGKSSVLRALDFFFNPSTTQISEEAFWNKDTSLDIRIECLFSELNDKERENLAAYLRPDGSFLVARQASYVEQEAEEGVPTETKVAITQQYSKPVPVIEWLNDANVSAKNIDEWWKDQNRLQVNGKCFVEYVGGAKPKVGEWKEKVASFAAECLEPSDYKDDWVDNPKGYAGVLKAALPFFVLVPAVRDVSEESKVSKTNPFGRLIYAVMDAVAEERKGEVETALLKVAEQLNRGGGDSRIQGIRDMESKLNVSINQIFSNCDLEIEFQTPTFEVLMRSPKIYANDGFRGLIDNKGHGLQRATIFSILRSYADFIATANPETKRTLILAVEEPELYMHPLAQRTIRKVFAEIVSGGDQVLFTTHSALLVDVAYFDEIIRVEGVTFGEGDKKTITTNMRQLPVQFLVDDEIARHPALAGKVTPESIREHYFNAYNPSRNEGFFAKRILLVEGATEDYALPIYAEALNYPLDALGVAIVECGGKCSMDRHYRIFNEMGIPCYILIDYDKDNSKKEIVEKSVELLRMLDSPTEAPNIFSSYNQIACFEHTWEQAMRSELSDYQALKDQATAHLGSVAGKPLVARFIARRITAENPPRVPKAIREIISHVLAVEWSGTCLKKLDEMDM